MNNEQQQIIDEAYENYQNYPLATIHDDRTNLLYQNIGKGWCIMTGLSMISPNPTRHLTKEEFINKIKTDSEFSEQWELKIEEREMSLEERKNLYFKLNPEFRLVHENMDEQMDKHNIPTKLITITYNNETIESYE